MTEYVGAYNHRLSDKEKKKKIADLRQKDIERYEVKN